MGRGVAQGQVHVCLEGPTQGDIESFQVHVQLEQQDLDNEEGPGKEAHGLPSISGVDL
jgi:hypothetical protein